MNTKEKARELAEKLAGKLWHAHNPNQANYLVNWTAIITSDLQLEQLLADKRRLDGFEMLQCDILYMPHSKRWKVGDNEPHESLRTAIDQAMEKTK